jgi:uncharacterized Fe-S cluster-containing radical SAM superfamily protein
VVHVDHEAHIKSRMVHRRRRHEMRVRMWKHMGEMVTDSVVGVVVLVTVSMGWRASSISLLSFRPFL